MTVFNLYNRNDVLAYSFEVDLDSVFFRFDLQFNRADGAWYFSVFDSEGCLLRAGTKMITNVDLFREWSDSFRPAGQLMAYRPVRRADGSQSVGEREFGDTVFLVYRSAT